MFLLLFITLFFLKLKLLLFFRGSVIESTTLPIPLILKQCQLPIVIANVIASISFIWLNNNITYVFKSFAENFSNFNLALKNLYMYKSDKKT